MFIPFGEFAPDAIGVNKNASENTKNVVWRSGGYAPIYNLGSSLDVNTETGIYSSSEYKDLIFIPGSTEELGDHLILYPSNNELLNNNANLLKTGITFGDSSPVGRAYLLWDKDTYYFFGNEISTPQKLTSTNIALDTKSIDIIDVAAFSSVSAKVCAKVREFAVIGNINDASISNNKVRWSEFNDPDNWTIGSNQADQQPLKSSSDIIAISGGSDGVIFQRDAITRMTYVGTPLIFEFDQIASGINFSAGQSIVEVNEDIYFYTYQGFYVLKNRVSLIPLGNGKVTKWMSENLGASGAISLGQLSASMKGVHDKTNNLIFWMFNYKPDSSDFSKSGLITYNYLDDKWTFINTTDFTGVSNGIESISETYITDDPSPGSNTNPLNISFLVWDGSTNYNIYNLDGSGMTGTIETGDVSLEGRISQATEARVLTDGTLRLEVDTRNALTDAVTTSSQYTAETSGECKIREQGRYHRYRVEISTAFDIAEGVEVNLKPLGKR